MAIVTLPSFDDPFHRFTATLEGVDYVFEFRYNQRENAWYFSIALTDGTMLREGVKVVCMRHLLARAAEVRLPPGVIMAVPNGADHSPPGFGELGDDRRVVLTYFTSDEVLTA